MESNLYSCIRTGCTILQKTMEDGNIVIAREDKCGSTALATVYCEKSSKLASNGHEFAGEPSSPPEKYSPRQSSSECSQEDRSKKRINPLRIHLGKRPFIDNSLQYYNPSKKRKIFSSKSSETIKIARNTISRTPKYIPKHTTDWNQFQNVAPQMDSITTDSEKDKPVPRLVPKSQFLQFKKGKVEKGSQLKEYAQSLGLQPMVKFKCRKCCSMSFKTLAMLKEHQSICRVQVKEPALSPEAAPNAETNSGGPSRVTRKVYLCSACGTYYENWNLFLHMREVHNRHICLFCLGMFSKAEKLSSHLTNKHNVQEFIYESKEDFFNVYNGTLYLMCCVCDEICSEQDDFFNHDCNNIKPKPVPVLISKNAVKPNSNIRNSKNNEESSTNGPIGNVREFKKSDSDNKFDKKESDVTSSQDISQCNEHRLENNDRTICLDSTSTITDSSNILDSEIELNSSHMKSISSPLYTSPSSNCHANSLQNGDDSLEHSESNDSNISEPETETNPRPVLVQPAPQEKSEDFTYLTAEKERECGIKLKLSLNNAKSPVIINSTVDPSVGQQNTHKPPTRVRRPPKRYEKQVVPELQAPPKTPSIKMTICDKADSPFVKTTIYGNSQEITLKNLLNNNLISTPIVTDCKAESTVKTTIYDNKLDEVNTLNRVPKLTVRVPKELLDKDSSSDYSSDSDLSDKLTVDENKKSVEDMNGVLMESTSVPQSDIIETKVEEVKNEPQCNPLENEVQMNDEKIDTKVEVSVENEQEIANASVEVKSDDTTISDEVPIIELSLDRPLDKYPLKELLKLFLSTTVFNCIYCNHVRKIAVNCEQLSLHVVTEHRFSATVDSITAEELMPETIAAKVKARANEVNAVYINLDSYDSEEKCEKIQYDHTFECFQCYFKTTVHKDLYLHNRKMHQKTILLCVMCKTNFYSYSELLCHLCPGTYNSEYEMKYRCCLCNVDSIPSSFRLMVHLRKIHHTCDVCLEFCYNQARLSNHVWKHKLHHLCYRCGIAYRNKPDITKHLFWKHGTESVMCKKCLQKKWPHVYHFCTPSALFVCDECSLQFTRAVYLKVHKRFHSGEFPHVCSENGCSEKFVSKKLLMKHIEEHIKKLVTEDLNEDKKNDNIENISEASKEPIPVIDLVENKSKEETGSADIKTEALPEAQRKKSKKKKFKEKDALLLDVNLPALNLSESDSSDESDSGLPPPKIETLDETKHDDGKEVAENTVVTDQETTVSKVKEKSELNNDENPNEQKVLDIWNNFQKYQAKIEKHKEKTPPLVPIRKHVCDSDHDYILIPTDMNGDEDGFSLDKKKNKKSPKKRHGDLSSSSSSSSDSDSSCSCGSNCSCSSSSGSSSSSSSDSDSSDDSDNEKRKNKQQRKLLSNRRISNGSNVDVMGMSETPILVPEKSEPLIAETDLETDESETDEEFYDKHPQHLANKLFAEKRNQLIQGATVALSDEGIASREPSRCTTPVIKEEKEKKEEVENIKEKPPSSSKKKSKKKKKTKNSKKHGPIKINIPKGVIANADLKELDPLPPPLVPNKITISLQSNTVQIPEAPSTPKAISTIIRTSITAEKKRSSKRRRVPNKFYGYSSDEESPQSVAALKPQQPPKLEWRKEDLPSPVTHKAKKEVPSATFSNKLYSYTEPIRLKTPIPDPEPPRILMNSESMESSDSDTSDEGALEIYQPNNAQNPPPVPAPAPTYLNSGTSSLPYPFQRPAVRQAREGESVYCYCRCPYDEVSEMIACDAEGCPIEWFHFECVGIMVPPKGKWYCPECRTNQSFSGYR